MCNYKTYIAALIFGSLSIATGGCKKDKLTKATQDGANTFSCLISGEVFKPCQTPGSLGFGGPPLSGGISVGTKVFAGASARCHGSAGYDRKDVMVYIENFQGVGEYVLSNPDNNCDYEYNYTHYESKNTGNGKIVITKDDRANHILSGRFEFTGSPGNNPSDVVKVTNGRFDIKY